MDVLRGLRGAQRMRSVGGDLQIFAERLAEFVDGLIEFAGDIGVAGDGAPCERSLHRCEVRRRGARVIDRHQRFVERLGDQHAGMLHAERSIAAERAGDDAHREKGDEDPATNGGEQQNAAADRPAPPSRLVRALQWGRDLCHGGTIFLNWVFRLDGLR